MTALAWPSLDGIPEGYYAIPDPADPDTITYWRRILTEKRTTLKAWPAKAWYGPPVPRRSEVPEDPAAREAFGAAWSESRRAYIAQVAATIAADPVAAGRRFSEFSIRCCYCARKLRDELSRCYGIGPECRAGIPAAVLARYGTPAVGRAHAAHLAQQPGEDG
ncbi:DUF6011 domain-containing protein [Streptomyces goshikiensis]|uniref:DUF6011 domain-containing protein n=1 Tax=Streptomyces goshikiensis TaxID=1942 RepID=UPI00364DD1C2